MPITDALRETLLDGRIENVLVGLHWTAVVVDTAAGRRCGLASTLSSVDFHHGMIDVPQAGQLETMDGRQMADLVDSEQPVLASLGMAAINALLPQYPGQWTELNASAVLAEKGAGKSVAIIGHFPFLERLKDNFGALYVLEQNPQPGDYPADAASDILPGAEVVAISGMTLTNHTLDDLLSLCSPGALLVLVGPSTPLSPVMFDFGLDILCGSVVTAVEPVLKVIGQAGTFRQVRDAGVRMVTMLRPGVAVGG
jgi:uncharacterized protein (DUF4213/DUF364 family)